MNNYVTFRLNKIKDILLEQGEKCMPYINDLMQEYNFILNKYIDSRRAIDSHHMISVYNPFYKKYMKIDEEIVDLIKEIWSAGIQTNNSCQDNVPKGFVWISFTNSLEVQKFLKIIFEGLSTEDNKYRDVSIRGLYSRYYYPKSWKYDIIFYAWTPTDEDEDEDDETVLDIDHSVSIRFPTEDLEFVYNRLFTHNHQ